MTRTTATQARRYRPTKAEAARFARLATGKDPLATDSDLPDDVPATAKRNGRPRSSADCSQPVTIRMDADVLAFFRSQGLGYQTRINSILREYVEHYRV
jgi:uncharacterized protein (DUF4415 family)